MDQNNASNYSEAFEAIREILAEQMNNLLCAQMHMGTTTAKVLSNHFAEIVDSSGYFSTGKYTSAFQVLVAQIREAVLCLEPQNTVVEVPEKTMDAFRLVSPIVPEPQQSIFSEIVSSDADSHGSSKKITFSAAVSLLNILLVVLGLILQYLPDDQLDRIIEQNDIQIEQTEEIIQNGDDLVEALNNIGDGLYMLADQIKLLREEAEDSDCPPEIPSDSDTENQQEENADTQDQADSF